VIIGTCSAYLVGYITTFIPSLADKQSQHKGLDMFVPPWIMIGAFAFSAGVGLFFGIYPAIRASRLDPIQALRHE
jgi:putative ABC transport system permease protein